MSRANFSRLVSPKRLERLVHQVSDWCSGVAIKMGRWQGGASRPGTIEAGALGICTCHAIGEAPRARCHARRETWVSFPFGLQLVIGYQYFSGAFADNDAGSHCVTCGHARHNRSVGNAQVFDSIYLEIAAYYRHRITSHLGSTCLMPVGND